MDKPRRKAAKRFEQLNVLVDHVGPHLPTPTHLAVLLVAFRHGRGNGYFRVSTERIAQSVNLKKRRVVDIIDDLQRLEVIQLVQAHQGPLPAIYRINFREANGALHCTIKQLNTPQINDALQSA